MLTWHQSMYCSISWVILPSLIKILGTPSLVASIPDPKGAICHFPTEHRGLSAVSHPWHFILGCKPTQCALQVTPVVANRSTSSVLRPPDQSSPPPPPWPGSCPNPKRPSQFTAWLPSFLPTYRGCTHTDFHCNNKNICDILGKLLACFQAVPIIWLLEFQSGCSVPRS